MFAEFGAGVIDADTIAHQVVEPGSDALEEIRCAFGEDYITPEGNLDRKKMAIEVFTSPTKRAVLEAIIHPRVREEMDRRTEVFRASHACAGKPLIAILKRPPPLRGQVDTDGRQDGGRNG